MSEEKVRKAIEKGNITFSARAVEAINSMNLGDPNHVPDFTLTEVELDHCWGPFNDKKTGEQVNKGGFNINWMSKSAGCGRITFYLTNEGKWCCYNQDMSKEFIQKVFAKFLESVTLDS